MGDNGSLTGVQPEWASMLCAHLDKGLKRDASAMRPPEHFREKWIPLFVRKMHQIKAITHIPGMAFHKICSCRIALNGQSHRRGKLHGAHMPKRANKAPYKAMVDTARHDDMAMIAIHTIEPLPPQLKCRQRTAPMHEPHCTSSAQGSEPPAPDDLQPVRAQRLSPRAPPG